MRRLIKFRIWDGDAMYDSSAHPDFTLCDFADMTNPVNREWMKENEPDFERYHLMQFTGLLDKNGEEIYEGDIVENHWPEKTDGIYVVRFSSSDFGPRFEIVNNATGVNRWWQEGSCEVIGNIHENPELIK